MKVLKFLAVFIIFIISISTLYCLIRGFNPLSLLNEPTNGKTPIILQYKETDIGPLEINLYEPTRNIFRNSPLIIYIHGGSWKHGRHTLGSEELEIIRPLQDFGFAVASIQYRLTNETNKFPDHINDVTDAIRYLHANAGELKIDKKRFCELGGSAGAHLSLLAAFAQEEFGESEALEDVKYNIKSVVALSTPCDFVDLSCYEDDDLVDIKKLLNEFLGFNYEENPKIYEIASPITYIGKSKLPILMIHGDKDSIVPIAQGDNFYAKAKKVGMKIEYIRVQNGKHGLGSYDGSPTFPEQDELLQKLVFFLLKSLI